MTSYKMVIYLNYNSILHRIFIIDYFILPFSLLFFLPLYFYISFKPLEFQSYFRFIIGLNLYFLSFRLSQIILKELSNFKRYYDLYFEVENSHIFTQCYCSLLWLLTIYFQMINLISLFTNLLVILSLKNVWIFILILKYLVSINFLKYQHLKGT